MKKKWVMKETIQVALPTSINLHSTSLKGGNDTSPSTESNQTKIEKSSGKESFLGLLEDPKKGIVDYPELGYFTFYVAGYTKTVGGIEVQPEHRNVWKLANNGSFTTIPMPDAWPFGPTNEVVRVHFKHEVKNKYDPYATLVYYSHDQIGENPGTGYTGVLGYVPKAISRLVHQNLDRIYMSCILKTKEAYKKDHYTTKIACFYKIPEKPDFGDVMLNRIADLEL